MIAQLLQRLHHHEGPDPLTVLEEQNAQLRAEVTRSAAENVGWRTVAAVTPVFALAEPNERLTSDFDVYNVLIPLEVLKATGLFGMAVQDCWNSAPMSPDQAHLVMQQHIECDRDICRRRQAAYQILCDAGHLKPRA